MKTKLTMLTMLAVSVLSVWGQTGTAALSARGQPTEESGKFTVKERGENHRVWAKVTATTNALGRVHYRTNSYTELATGMHYQKDGQWAETKAEIELLDDGAAATNGPHKVFFAQNLNTVGAVDMTTPDGKRLRSRILGLSYFDSSTGQAVLIAEIKDSLGLLIGNNQVIYTNAFNDVAADVQYIYMKAGLAQNIILRAQPSSPSQYGLNPATTRLQCLTEFFDPPAPQRKPMPARRANDLADEVVDFGKMAMGSGKAFSVGEERHPGRSLRVTKAWTMMEGRTFLVEEVPFKEVEKKIQGLEKKKRTASLSPPRTGQGKDVLMALKEVLPKPVASQKKTPGPIQMARANFKEEQGFVLDYEVMSSETDFTFRGDTTYLVADWLGLSGTTTLEGGAVIKYKYGGGEDDPGLYLTGPLVCQTEAYRPAIVTSWNDDTVGETIDDSSGTPESGADWFGIYAADSGSTNRWEFKNIRMLYSGEGIHVWDGRDVLVRDCQFVKIADVGAGVVSGGDLTVQNSLFVDSITPISASDKVVFENVTVNGFNEFYSGSPTALAFTNCLIFGGAEWSWGSAVFDHSYHDVLSGYWDDWWTNGMYGGNAFFSYFQTVGGGAHYLDSIVGGVFRNAGTTSIDPDLLADLKKKTTYPPLVLSNLTFSANTNLAIQAQRDTDTPDLGYHYDPLDFVCYQVTVTNATMQILPGTAIGTAGDWGIKALNASQLYSEGTPLAMNRIVRPALVQEQVFAEWLPGGYVPASVIINGQSSGAVAQFRFTEWPGMAGMGGESHYMGNGGGGLGDTAIFTDCQFHNGGIDVTPGGNNYTNYLNVTNCLFNHTGLNGISEHIGGFTSTIHLKVINCTFYQSYNGYEVTVGSTWFQNNAFIETEAWGSGSYNGFTTGWPHFGSPYVAATVDFQNGPLGHFYQPDDSDFLNAGSTTADVLGLYHYTVTTNLVNGAQIKEADSVVDIGFHYFTVAGDGSPLDSDGDGIPDYIEDGNWNGTYDSGVDLFNWQNADTDGDRRIDQLFKVRIHSPR